MIIVSPFNQDENIISYLTAICKTDILNTIEMICVIEDEETN